MFIYVENFIPHKFYPKRKTKMSTKSSIAYYPDKFHLYHECLDDTNVYLELENVEFEADNNNITVKIPLAIWETIRFHGGANLKFRNYTDEQLLEYVEKQVDERIAKYNAEPNKEKAKHLLMCGLFIYGSDIDRDAQISRGMTWMKYERDTHNRIGDEIDKYKKENLEIY